MEPNTNMSSNISNIILFDRIKTGNPIIDTIVLTFLLSVINFIIKWFNNNVIEHIHFKQILNYEKLYYFFSKKNIVEYEGKIACITNVYDNELRQTTSFSDHFRALWEYIIENIKDNPTIHSIKEYTITKKKYTSNDENENGLYMVNQIDKFLISEKFGIYAYTYIRDDENSSDNNRSNVKLQSKTEHIIIELYSYKSSIEIIKLFVEEITRKYLLNIQHLRENKQFIYTLTKIKYDESSCEQWDENIFNSIRTFDNMYFDNKHKVINTIDFFINNKSWYFEKGIPYSLGIGMYGPPGTGKTSLAKAIANYTKRHIVCISLKLIKTKKQLDSIFFEERYNTDNKKNSITFDKKIIIFEDIDCIGDIVLDREKKKKKNSIHKKIKMDKNNDYDEDDDEVPTKTSEEIENLIEMIDNIDEDVKKNLKNGINGLVNISKNPDEEPITLDDILNLWDGIRETPGRIMILSSNHYDDLDPALKRPGRIDITLELSYASRQVILDMYNHLFKETETLLCDEDLEKIPDKFYSPAEIINIYMNEQQNPEKFIKRLQMKHHV
jgi:AAA+ superfamily predicted ATPase